MLPCNVDRVRIKSDRQWETDFIPWLEEQEENNVGKEDGVFVATFDTNLRCLRPEDELKFVEYCASAKLKEVNTLHLTEFLQSGIYHHSQVPANPEVFNKFRESMRDPSTYKNDTCCTIILKENQENFEELFHHLEKDFIDVRKNIARGNGGFGSSKSIVQMEETGITTKKLFDKHVMNTKAFAWEKRQRKRAEECPDLECVHYDSEEECSNENSAHTPDECCVGEVLKSTASHGLPPSNSVLKKMRLEDGQNIIEACYGYGYESSADCFNVTPNFKMCRLFNILWLLSRHIPGLHSPYLYLGGIHSFFPVHNEDALLWSLNYLYLGNPKLWVVIPPWATDLLEFHMARSHLFLQHTSCRNILLHKGVLPTVKWMKERNIPFKIVVQRPGDLVILYPNAAHFGFNLGPNVAQAINVATRSWIPWGLNAKKCVCLSDTPVHIDVSPFVAAFNKDLLPHVLKGGVVLTAAMLRGMQLVRDEVAKTSTVVQCSAEGNQLCARQDQGSVVLMCPAVKCGKLFPLTSADETKKSMIHHVKANHRPIIGVCQLLTQVNDLFEHSASSSL